MTFWKEDARPYFLLWLLTVTVMRSRVVAACKLIRKEDGDVDALFYPEIEKADLRLFSEQERTLLLEQGKSIISTFQTRTEYGTLLCTD
jgi:hypothetical protein